MVGPLVFCWDSSSLAVLIVQCPLKAPPQIILQQQCPFTCILHELYHPRQELYAGVHHVPSSICLQAHLCTVCGLCLYFSDNMLKQSRVLLRLDIGVNMVVVLDLILSCTWQCKCTPEQFPSPATFKTHICFYDQANDRVKLVHSVLRLGLGRSPLEV